MAVTLRYFTEFGKPVFQYITTSICGGMYARVYSILYCVYDVVVKKVHGRNYSTRLLYNQGVVCTPSEGDSNSTPLSVTII